MWRSEARDLGLEGEAEERQGPEEVSGKDGLKCLCLSRCGSGIFVTVVCLAGTIRALTLPWSSDMKRLLTALIAVQVQLSRLRNRDYSKASRSEARTVHGVANECLLAGSKLNSVVTGGEKMVLASKETAQFNVECSQWGTMSWWFMRRYSRKEECGRELRSNAFGLIAGRERDHPAYSAR